MDKTWKNHNDHDMIREVKNSTNKLIREAKQTYYEQLGNKLSDPQTGHKNFWSAFKRIINKIPGSIFPNTLEKRS